MEEAKINLDYQDAIAVNALKDKIHSTAEVDFEEKPKITNNSFNYKNCK